MRLNRKILMVTIGTLAFSLFISSAVNVMNFRSNYTDALLTGSFGIGHSIESIFNELLDLGLPLESLSGMDRKFKEVVDKNPHIKYAGVTDMKGRVLFHGDRAQIGKRYSDTVTLNTLSSSDPMWQTYHRHDGMSFYDVAIPVIHGDRAIGVIRLGFSTENIDEKVVQAIRQILVNFLLTFTAIALILNFFLRKKLVEPVKQLSEYATSIAEGRFEAPVKIGSQDEIGNQDEIGRLSSALREMGSTIKQQIDAMRRSGLELEEKIEARTRQLEDANRTLQASNHDLKLALEREKKLSEALRFSEERFRMLFEANKAVMLTIDPGTGLILFANRAAVEYYGYTMDQLLQMHISDINTLSREEVANEMAKAKNEERNHFIFRHALASGEVRDVEVHSGPFIWDGKQVLYSIVHDITDRKRAEAELEHIAHYDSLTGLPNRRLKTDRLRQAIAHSKRNGTSVGVCYLDLDGFKPINDRFGHDYGDKILIEVANRLQTVLREEDTVSRIGGDEFVLILTNLTNLDECILILDRVLEIIAQPIQLDDTALVVSASIGITHYPEDDVDADILLRHADQAMYWAKDAGKNCYHLFDPQHDKQIKANRENFEMLNNALINQELILYFQPKVDMFSCDVIGVEALIRWMHPRSGLTVPGEFLSLAENTDLEIELGQWVIEHALRQVSQWQRLDLRLPVSVNISAHHLQHAGFISHLRRLFTTYTDVTPDMLELEILETSSIEDTNDIYHTLTDCREMGIKISLDDFGTGYSSLAYFHRLPVDILKIDQNFVQDMLDDPQDLTIVDSVVRLAHAFEHPVIAEGVESIEHASALLQLGCRLGQGFGIAKPMPADEIPQWLVQWHANTMWRSLKERVTQSHHIDVEVALASHRKWVGNLIGYITQGTDFNHGHLDSKHCNFNYWFHGIGFIQYGNSPQYGEINRLHEQIHALGYKLISMNNMGSKSDAQQGTAELEALSGRFVELMEGLTEEPNIPDQVISFPKNSAK
ncbi:MAG: EAL domain-containing protein [Candidatus Thiodiazotropha sp.]|nr:EAL domain-containing protein [Candidatus Thiodiazotropha sp. (ex Lucina pensylvanica)]